MSQAPERRPQKPDATVAALADVLFEAHAVRRGIAPPERLAGLSLNGAYAVQDALVARRTAAGSILRGWKLGITSPVKQRVMGIDHPLFGRLFAGGELLDGAEFSYTSLIAPRAEPEIAIVLARTIDATMDREALAASVAAIAPALEITDSRYGSGVRTAVELVADNTSSAAYVLAPSIAIANAPNYGNLSTELLRNGIVILAGSTADVLGDPLNALTALAAHLQTHGHRAEAGDVILSGAITDAIAVRPGDVIEARIAGLGAASVTFR